MAEFLSTKAIAYHIEEIIKKAEKELYIVTPYLKLSETFFERLQSATSKNLMSYFIYGKSELTQREEVLMTQLNTNVLFKENLHGKCYLNENFALITSMNLHSFSEANNREFGVLLDRRKDAQAYQECLEEIKSVILTSKILKRANELKLKTPTAEIIEYDPAAFIKLWHKLLSLKYPEVIFKLEDNIISAEKFPIANTSFSTKYGFVGVEFTNAYDHMKYIKGEEINRMYELLSEYRFFWSSADKMSLYGQKNRAFTSYEEELEYCKIGLDLIVEDLRSEKMLRYFDFNAASYKRW